MVVIADSDNGWRDDDFGLGGGVFKISDFINMLIGIFWEVLKSLN